MNWIYPASDEAFEAIEQYWKSLFINILNANDVNDWITPYYNNQLADGTWLRDGNPIFSAKSRTSGRSLRIVLEPFEEFAELRHWVDESDRIDAKMELVIVCAWTEQQVAKAEEIMAAWLCG